MTAKLSESVFQEMRICRKFLIFKYIIMRLKDKEAKEKMDIRDEFKLRQEFRVWVSRMEEMYINRCDELGIEPNTIWFTDFCWWYDH